MTTFEDHDRYELIGGMVTDTVDVKVQVVEENQQGTNKKEK